MEASTPAGSHRAEWGVSDGMGELARLHCIGSAGGEYGGGLAAAVDLACHITVARPCAWMRHVVQSDAVRTASVEWYQRLTHSGAPATVTRSDSNTIRNPVL